MVEVRPLREQRWERPLTAPATRQVTSDAGLTYPGRRPVSPG